MTAQFTPAQLAQVDQAMSRLNEVLDGLLADARADRDAHGPAHAMVSIAYGLIRTRPPGNLASIAAAAVLRLLDHAEPLRELRPWPRALPLMSRDGSLDAIPTPNGCFACGHVQRGHGHRWHWLAEMHYWMDPGDEQRLARMRARREYRQIARVRARRARP